MRLVDADALTRYIETDWRVRKKSRTVHSPMDDAQDFTFQRCLTLIERMPTVDAQPVKYGRWIFADDGYCRCSECKQKAPSMEDEVTMTDICPHCGAKMGCDAGD